MLGGKVCLIESGDEKDPEAIIAAIEKNKVTATHFVPSMMNIFLHYVEVTSSVNRLASLKQVFSCGEAISLNQVEQFNRLLYNANGTMLYNMYGPTEATVEVACFDCSPEVSLPTVPIGKRIDNFNVYILDKNRTLLPVGIPGEIYISGAGVGRGYLNNSELTAERFIRNPFVHGEKMYRTGDRARWYPKGDIEFLGRMDFQVKIKGFRIEIGEIEAKLVRHESIHEAAVKPFTDAAGNTYLAAYVVLKNELSTDEIRRYAAEKLPDYMVPGSFVILEKMPLNNNGKIDRNALPEPGGYGVASTEYVPPTNEIETVLSEIWRKTLNLERVGMLDEYAAIGGDSLTAIKIITEIHRSFGVEISPRIIFQLQTISKISEQIAAASRQKSSYHQIPNVPQSESYPVSASQKRQYILNKVDGGISYNLPGGMLIKGKVDTGRLENAFRMIIKRHESLRTSFELRNGQPVQVVHNRVDFGVEYLEAQDADNDKLMQSFVRPFDLAVPPLMRVRLVKIGENRNVLLFDMHHIISDGASVNIIIKDFTELYNGGELPDLKIQYKDYSAWHNELINSEKIKQQEAYWLDRFSGELPVLNMPLDFTRPSFQSFKGNKFSFTIDQKLTKGIRDLTSKTGTTLFMLLLASYNVLLSRYTGQEDIIIGTPVEGRRHADLRELIGMFVNTLAIRSFPAGDKAFAAFLNEVKEDLLNAYDNQEYPFEELVEKVSVRRDMSRNPLFDTTLVLQNMDLTKLALGSLAAVPYTYNNRTAKFDLALEAVDKGETIECCFEYCTDLFLDETISRLAGHYINTLNDIIMNPAKKLSDINLMSEAERNQLLYEFNDTDADYPRDKTIHQMFEEQTAKTPDNVALIFNDGRMTYRELNERANRLARTLRAKGVGPDDIVGLLIDRSFEMIIAILGVLKAGGAYMPIDPGYPAERKAYMLEDSGAKLLLTKQVYTSDIVYAGTVLDLYDESSYAPEGSNLEIINKPADLAYIIYTSGSTGRPKGTLIAQKSVVNFCSRNEHNVIDFIITEDLKRIISVTTISFDIFVTESLLPLLNGMSVIIADENEQNYQEKLSSLIIKYQVEIIQTTPSKMELLISDNDNLGYLSILKVIILGGEALSPAFLSKLRNKTNARIFNAYGPTETTVWSSLSELKSNIVTIGRPIANTQIYIIDKNMNLLPVGIPGDVYIAGEGLSSGYYKNTALTNQNFIDNPFQSNRKMYRTGDMAYWHNNGEIVYIGRNDFQIKMRGIRIELGEIETLLNTHDAISSAIVKGITENGYISYLCAYIKPKEIFNEAQVRNYLYQNVPEYMIPSCFVVLNDFPMTANGKIDRNALPAPNYDHSVNAHYEPPGNEIEEELAKIWSSILDISDIGVLDDYFEIGGDSLKSIKIIIEINKRYGTDISSRDMLQCKNIRALGRCICNLEKQKQKQIPVIPEHHYYPVSSAQKRQFILHKINETIIYNLSGGFVIEGKLDLNRMECVIKKIIERQESLRTSFDIRDGLPVQIVNKTVDFSVEYLEAEEVEFDTLLNAFVKPFDLSVAPLMRVRLVRFSDNKHILLFDMHHIISDGASINALTKEFVELYTGGSLPELKVQYKDYSAWHHEFLVSEGIKNQEAYWLDRFSGEIPSLDLPLDFARPSIQSFKGNKLYFKIDEKLTKEIRVLTARTGTTLFMFLLASYNILLSRYTGQEDIVIGTPVEGRRHPDLRDLIGMFVNTLAIRSYPVGGKTFRAYLSEVKEDLLNAYDNQEYPFEMLVEKVGVKRDVSRNPLFDAMFVLQNMDLTKLEEGCFHATPFTFNNRTAKFDLTLEAIDRGDTLECSFEYCTDLFAEETIRRLAEHFINAVNDIAENPDNRLSDVNILSEAEHRQMLFEFNDTDADYPSTKTIQQIFEEQAAAAPGNTALVFNGARMTYSTLNERANRLARTLRAKGVGPDDIVGIMIDRSFEMVISILAVLKAGSAYMPIDPEYPAERKTFMLDDSGAKVLLSRRESAEGFAFNGTVTDLFDESCYAPDGSNLDIINKPSDLAYIIYTSGSTGRPKGVMIEHRNVVRLLFNEKFQFCFDNTDIWTLFHSYCFDFSVWEMYGALLYGGRLIIISREAAADTRQFHGILQAENVTVLNQTPSAFYNLINEDASSQTEISSLRYVVFGGEALKPPMLKSFKEKYPGTKLINMYGITETTVHVTYKEITLADTERNTSNIGTPIPTLKVYILDKYMNLLPIGVPGEIYVGGLGVARGYLNNPELTQEKFIRNNRRYAGTIYRSGDLGRIQPNGEIEYLGRIDSQVKIRGYRIELGELESALLKHPDIEETVVTVYKTGSGDKKLCAYFKARAELPAKDLSAYLSGSLPDYMIPAYFVRVDAFPLNKNGKIDKPKLPKPNETIAQSDIVKPRNVTEEIVASAWAEVLDIPAVGINDNFFELGGDSLSAIKVVSMLKLGINLVDFYTHPTVRALAEKMMNQNSDAGMLVKLTRKDKPSNCKIVCFPYGGGSAIAYRDLSDSLLKRNADIDLYAVNLPGHDYGKHDTLLPIKEIAEMLANEIAENLTGELVLYSHCVGSALLVATAVELEAAGIHIKSAFIGGIIVPKYVRVYGWFYKPWRSLSDLGVINYLTKIGLSKEVLSDEKYVNYIVKAFRHDTYEFTKYFYSMGKSKNKQLNVPLYLLIGDKDITTKKYMREYREWNKYFARTNLYVLENANHYFINTHADAIVDYISSTE
jgi:amino acid adenylation domain-containing protein